VDGEVAHQGADAEYAGLYRRFAELVALGRSEVDVSPLRHVADAFLRGRRVLVEPFVE
jgi:D-galactose 1-dehydrogenase